MPDGVQSGNHVTEKKQRQRARIAAENPGVSERKVRAERADRLREFLSADRVGWENVEPHAQHICDLMAWVQQFQVARQGIITLQVPGSYLADALLAKQCGRVYVRVFLMEDIDEVMDEKDAEEEAADWETGGVDSDDLTLDDLARLMGS